MKRREGFRKALRQAGYDAVLAAWDLLPEAAKRNRDWLGGASGMALGKGADRAIEEQLGRSRPKIARGGRT